MKVFNTSMSLDEMEQKLSEELKNPENNIRILGDLNLSYEDYSHLLHAIKDLEQHIDNVEVLKKYRLSVLISWIFSLRIEKNEAGVGRKIKSYLSETDPELVHLYVTTLLQAFEEYSLNSYQLKEDSSMADLLELLVVHTGIPTELQDDFYHLLDDSLVYGEFTSIANRFLMRLPQHMKNLYQFVNRDVVIAMIDDCRKMFKDYRIHGITQREAYAKYPIMSSDIMKGCFQWCEAQEMYAKCLG